MASRRWHEGCPVSSARRARRSVDDEGALTRSAPSRARVTRLSPPSAQEACGGRRRQQDTINGVVAVVILQVAGHWMGASGLRGLRMAGLPPSRAAGPLARAPNSRTARQSAVNRSPLSPGRA